MEAPETKRLRVSLKAPIEAESPTIRYHRLFHAVFSSEIELLKDRYAKLLLGEDMSGCGKGVPSSLALSNAITNLAGAVLFPRS